ncbi:unnamed protein product [Ectocarpus sp. CCAP 1310/34]|nr:unnamed protein product [Ectocarpus sp. CCAP 1310/34]
MLALIMPSMSDSKKDRTSKTNHYSLRYLTLLNQRRGESREVCFA